MTFKLRESAYDCDGPHFAVTGDRLRWRAGHLIPLHENKHAAKSHKVQSPEQ